MTDSFRSRCFSHDCLLCCIAASPIAYTSRASGVSRILAGIFLKCSLHSHNGTDCCHISTRNRASPIHRVLLACGKNAVQRPGTVPLCSQCMLHCNKEGLEWKQA